MDKGAISLDAPVTAVRAVSPARAEKLKRLNIYTVRDLLRSFPHRYIDLTNISTAAEAQIGQTVTVIGRLEGIRQRTPRPRMNIIEAALVDETGSIQGVWFRQPWIAKKLNEGDLCAFSGKVAFNYGMKQIVSPYMEVLSSADGASMQLGMIPVHAATEAISTSWMRRFVANALEQVGDVSDPLPATLRCKYHLMGRKAALNAIHFPKTAAQQQQARRRLGYEEALCLQLEMMLQHQKEVACGEPMVHEMGECFAALRAALPFTLTAEQEQAVDEIAADMQAPVCMNRMLLGDVGCGKTIVAAHALALVADSEAQAAMMAPTEVLARQYEEKLGSLLRSCGIACATLTGSTPPEDRQQILAAAADGSLHVLFGTHALIEPDVVFKNLTLVVIDEQHRFGVNQRSALRAKGQAVDFLTMTATPIPRTLALTLYGDLETTYIKQRPANRPPVKTQVISRDERWKAYDAIRQAVAAEQQAYIICPLVGLTREQRAKAETDGSMAQALRGGADVANLKAAADEAEFLSRKVLTGMNIGLLTGKMSSAEKKQAMADFSAGNTDVLVATTVVEVGVDVPNATVMMIEDAERFGLSQLHQLRGRVGRGSVAGQVFLVADPKEDDVELQQRMNAIATITDGFELSAADLSARREGDVLGNRQHGASILRLVNVIEDAALIQAAHNDAKELIAASPVLDDAEYAALRAEVAIMFKNEVDGEEPK